MTARRIMLRRVLTVAGLAVAALGCAAAFGPAAMAAPGTAVITTVPPIGGVELTADGARTHTAASSGRAQLPVRDLRGLDERLRAVPTQVTPDLRVVHDRTIGGARGIITIGLRTERLVTYRFAGPDKAEIAPERISHLELRSNTGQTITVDGADVAKPLWLAASRTQQTPQGLVSKDMYWTVSHVTVDGTEVVNKGQQKFVPNVQRDWTVRLLFYQVRVVGKDALFGGPAGSGVELQRPDGVTLRVPLTDGTAQLANVPRGHYKVRLSGAGVSFMRPVGISKDQELALEVITPLDIAAVGCGVLFAALGLIVVGRRERMIPLGDRLLADVRLGAVIWWRRITSYRTAVAVSSVAVVTVVVAALATPHASAEPARTLGGAPAPLLAYYYIWYNPDSWNRAKQDYPLLGRYSSADPEVMRRHLDLAASAGITGFLVSWKHTDFLDPRLETLVDLARERNFKLGIVYEGLDFQRRPLPEEQVAQDLRWFADRYAGEAVFDLFGKPVVIITGTEQFGADQLARITEPVRPRLQVLASAKSVTDYERTAGLFDGDAYYWSSGDPAEAAYRAKLARMGEVVRAHAGLWFAPAPAGFDARDLGGHRVVPREGGETLRRAVDAARASVPDAVAVISWNEFSENSHIEPSEQYGTAAVQALAEIVGARPDLSGVPGDSSDAAAGSRGLPSWAAITLIVGLAALLPVGVAIARRRSRGPPVRHRDDGS